MGKFYTIKTLGITALTLLVTAKISVAQFLSPLPIPELLDSAHYNLTIDREVHNFNPLGADSSALNFDMNTYAYNHAGSLANSYLGPTMVWRHGRQQTLSITNNLHTPNASSPGPYNAPTTTHLHGAHVAAWVDGGPHGVIEPGSTRTVTFDVLDDPCTLWYHPHGIDETYTQVEMGLAGIILVKNPADVVDALLPHRYGIDDFPLILQDHVFDTVAGIQPRRFVGGIDTSRNQKTHTAVVNGIVEPYLNVPPQPVRFRILDGSSRWSFQVGFGTVSGQVGTPLPFKVIGSDGGYLSDSARTVTTFTTGPGIRNEVVFDFTNHAGQTLYLLNMWQDLPGGIIGPGTFEGNTGPALMEFRVGTSPSLPLGMVPALPHLTPYDTNLADTVRIKQLIGHGKPGPIGFSINNNQYEYDVVNDIVNEGAIEVWRIWNRSGDASNAGIAHPFHIHDIQFYVTEVKDTLGQTLPIPVEYLGKKDDILVPLGHIVSFVTKFEDFGRPKPFTGANLDSAAYMYHCHILTHEDGYYGGATVQQRDGHGMMQQFVVWNGLFTNTDEQELTDDMVLFPNPATNRLNLQGESTVPSKVRIYDLQGRTLLTQDLKAFNGTTAIDVSMLDAGMILVEWESAKGKFTKKVVLQ